MRDNALKNRSARERYRRNQEEAKQLQEARQKMACFLIALKDAKTPKQCASCGKTFTSNNGESVRDYIGQYTDFNANDSTSVSSYKWSKIIWKKNTPVNRRKTS